MKKYLAVHEALSAHLSFAGKTVIDVGCGNGDSVRWLAAQGARVTGLDSPEMLAKAGAATPGAGEAYIAGVAQSLPFADACADLIIYLASFHHVTPGEMELALGECRRVLKQGGRAVFVEPVYRAGSYTELTRLVEDEREVQKKARAAIARLSGAGLVMVVEELFFMERSFADYERLVGFFIDDASRRPGILGQAREITGEFCAAAGLSFDRFRFRSICRLNILRKESSS